MHRILLVIGFCLSLVLPQIAYSQTCADVQGATTRHQYSSAIVGQQMFYTVYTPPCYDSINTTYPVVYLMHGSNDDDNQWLRLGIVDYLDTSISKGEIESMVFIFPFGNVIANRNQFERLSWRSIFLEELIPDVEAQYRISSQRDERAIGGISRGGFWAYQIAFSEPDMFAAVGGHSAFFDEFHAQSPDNPLDLAINEPQVSTMKLWLDRGADDFAAPGLDLMDERLASVNANYQYTIYPEGQHNSTYWSQHVVEYVRFYADALQKARQAVPASTVPLFVTNTPTAPIAEPTNVPQQTPQVGHTVYYPAIAFPSLETSLSSTTIDAIVAGELQPNLVLPERVVTEFQYAGITIHPNTRVVADEQIFSELWRDRTKYSFLPIDMFDIRLRVLWVDDQPVDTIATYPFTLPSEEVNSVARVTMSGVTALTRNTRIAIDNSDIEWAASGIRDYATQSDIFHMSNEVSAVGTCPNTNNELLGGSNSFCMMPKHLELFDMLELDILELTGNHNNDYGYQAYLDTLAFYQASDYVLIGGGETPEQAQTPYITTLGDTDIAFLACNAAGPYYALANDDPNLLGGTRPGAASCDWAWLEIIIPQLASQTDVVIVTVQYPEVEEYVPLPQQEIDFRRIADLGADVVLGTQAHKPQTYEFYNTGGSTVLIHYGMGNLFFDQPFWGNMRFFMNTLHIADGEVKALEIYPGIIDDLARPRLMTPDERINFLHYMFIQQNGF